ncbi:MAG: hypothetical protein VZR27_08315 [Acutalibacteraceae bacterium]|nr:hypothetical protein [Acutalibacteraceae bacterium]
MNSEITITAEELLYLGKLINAHYLDYAYIVCLKNVSKDLTAHDKIVKQELIKKEYIFESFSGKIEVEESVTDLLLPVFNGKKETSLNIFTINGQAAADITKYHFLNETIIMVKEENGSLILKNVEPYEIEKNVRDIFSNETDFTDEKVSVENETENVSSMVSVKKMNLDKGSIVSVFLKCDGKWYIDKGSNVFESIGRKDMTNHIINILKG